MLFLDGTILPAGFWVRDREKAEERIIDTVEGFSRDHGSKSPGPSGLRAMGALWQDVLDRVRDTLFDRLAAGSPHRTANRIDSV
jgi:hypothetical protein